MRGWMLLCVLLAAAGAWATHAGNTETKTSYFHAVQKNREDTSPNPDIPPLVSEIAGYELFMLQAYRVIDGDAQLRRDFTKRQPEFTYDIREDFEEYGVTAAKLAKAPTDVYTLQVAAYKEARGLHTFLHRVAGAQDGDFPGTSIYRDTRKSFACDYYADDPTIYKNDPLYVEPAGQFTRVRYGIYENTTDAEADAAVWRKQFGVEPIVVRVPWSEALVKRVYWGELPGVWAPPR